MDQLKVIGAALKKYNFWVLCLVLLIASTVVWMLAVGSIKEQSQAHLAKIQATLSDAKSVSQISQHPNEQITQSYNAQTTQLKQEVFQVWDMLYKKQRTAVLKWPEALGEKFINFIQGVRFGDDIHVDLRETYHNYVKTRWDELPAIIKAKPIEEEKKSLTASRTAVPDWIVIWKDQDDIRRKLFTQQNPTNEWVWSTQEDLWIYENLLNIIKLTNEGALGPHNAVISSIINMDVGKQAASGAGGTENRISSGSDSALDTGDEGSGSGGGGSAGGLLSNRYVDDVGAPIPDHNTIKNDEYKQVPVRLVLRMDPKEIPQLIVNCANADLPVEIQQVRVNVDAGGRSKRIEAPVLSQEDRNAGRKVPHVEVSMQGVIYIFNPPNTDKLKMSSVASAGGAATAAEAFGTEGATGPEAAGEQPITDATSAFEETPAEGAPAPAADPAAEADPMVDPTAPATDPSAATSPPAATESPVATEPMATEPMETTAEPMETSEPAATEAEAEPKPAAGSIESLFEE